DSLHRNPPGPGHALRDRCDHTVRPSLYHDPPPDSRVRNGPGRDLRDCLAREHGTAPPARAAPLAGLGGAVGCPWGSIRTCRIRLFPPGLTRESTVGRSPRDTSALGFCTRSRFGSRSRRYTSFWGRTAPERPRYFEPWRESYSPTRARCTSVENRSIVSRPATGCTISLTWTGCQMACRCARPSSSSRGPREPSPETWTAFSTSSRSAI